MQYLYSIILGVVQGVSEFAPISSSGHLVLLHEWIALSLSSELAFDVALHGGTLGAIIVFFAKDIIQYYKRSKKLLLMLIISCIPAGIVGVLFEDIIDSVLRSSWVVVVMLIVLGIVFLIVEHYAKPKLPIENITITQALIIGAAQAFALIPGTSRSGITMVAGMTLGLNRVEAARFSFMMAIPIIGGATAKQLLELSQEQISSHEWGIIAVGALAAFIVGIIVIQYLLKFFQRYTLRGFAYYRFALAAVVILVNLL